MFSELSFHSITQVLKQKSNKLSEFESYHRSLTLNHFTTKWLISDFLLIMSLAINPTYIQTNLPSITTPSVIIVPTFFLCTTFYHLLILLPNFSWRSTRVDINRKAVKASKNFLHWHSEWLWSHFCHRFTGWWQPWSWAEEAWVSEGWRVFHEAFVCTWTFVSKSENYLSKTWYEHSCWNHSFSTYAKIFKLYILNGWPRS